MSRSNLLPKAFKLDFFKVDFLKTVEAKAITVNLVLVRTVKNNYFSLCTN